MSTWNLLMDFHVYVLVNMHIIPKVERLELIYSCRPEGKTYHTRQDYSQIIK